MGFEIPLFKIVLRPLLPVQGSWVDATPFVLVFLLLVGASHALHRARHAQAWRRQSQVFGTFLFVFFLHRCLCILRGWIFALNKVGRDDVIAFGYLCMFVLLVALTLTLGRVFCGWACPMGLVQEAMGWFARRRERLTRPARLASGYLLLAGACALVFWLAYLVRPGTKYLTENVAGVYGAALLLILFPAVALEHRDGRLRAVRYAALGVWLFLSVVGVFVTAPWCTLLGDELDYSSIVALLSVTLAAAVVSMAWCRYLCPIGTALGWLTGFSPVQLTNRNACTGCGACRTACPMGALDAGRIDRSSCIYCGRCVGTCGFGWEDRLASTERTAVAPAAPRPVEAG